MPVLALKDNKRLRAPSITDIALLMQGSNPTASMRGDEISKRSDAQQRRAKTLLDTKSESGIQQKLQRQMKPIQLAGRSSTGS